MYTKVKQKAQKSFPRLHALFSPYKTGVKYSIAGAFVAATNLGLFALLHALGIWYLAASIIAAVVSIVVSFLVQKFWTFRDRRLDILGKQVVIFAAMTGSSLVFTAILMYVFVDVLLLYPLVAQVLTMGILAVYAFVVNKFITFRKPARIKDTQKKQRLLIATGIYPPDIGGPATYVQTLQQELPQHGWEIRILTYADDSPRACTQHNAQSTSLLKVSRGQSLLARYVHYMWQVWKQLPWADVVYVQGPVSEGLPTWLACRLQGRQYVLKVVGDYAWEQYHVARSGSHGREEQKKNFVSLDDFQTKRLNFGTEVRRVVQRIVARGAKNVVVPSHYLKGIVEQWGVNEHAIEVVYNAVKLTQAQPKQKPAGEKWIVTAGRLVPWKGIDTLVASMPDVVQSEGDAKLVVIGDGPQEKMLQDMITTLQLTDTVRLLGRLPRSEVAAYVAAADVFVLNSAYEGLSHILLEVIAAGVPVVASDVGGNREVIEKAGYGSLVAYNDAHKLQQNIIAALKSGQHAAPHNFLQTFDQGVMVAEINRVLYESA